MVPQSAGCPPFPAKMGKMMPTRSLPFESHLWRMLPAPGNGKRGLRSPAPGGLASVQEPLETATPGTHQDRYMAGEARQSLGELPA